MQTDKLNEWLAVEVMGWKYVRGRDNYEKYCDKNNRFRHDFYGWNPAENIEQAMMCAFAAAKKYETIVIAIDCLGGTDVDIYSDYDRFEPYKNHVAGSFEPNDQAPLAICLAIARATNCPEDINKCPVI